MASIRQFPQPVAQPTMRRICKQPEVQSATGLPSSSMHVHRPRVFLDT